LVILRLAAPSRCARLTANVRQICMRQFAKMLLVIGMLCVTSFSSAQTAPEPGASFMKVFNGFCLARLPNLEALRTELKAKGFPTLEEPAAQAFLGGRPGDAWPVPENGSMGNFVLVLPTDHPQCSLFSRRAPTSVIEAQFTDRVSRAPAPFTSELKTDERQVTPANGEVHTLSYVWSLSGAPRGFAFFLSTASPEATFQVKATASRIITP
jgi:hypothetical protein